MFADEAVEQGAEDILLEVPAIDRATHIIGYLPNLALQGGALLGAGHLRCSCLVLIRKNQGFCESENYLLPQMPSFHPTLSGRNEVLRIADLQMAWVRCAAVRAKAKGMSPSYGK